MEENSDNSDSRSDVSEYEDKIRNMVEKSEIISRTLMIPTRRKGTFGTTSLCDDYGVLNSIKLIRLLTIVYYTVYYRNPRLVHCIILNWSFTKHTVCHKTIWEKLDGRQILV